MTGITAFLVKPAPQSGLFLFLVKQDSPQRGFD